MSGFVECPILCGWKFPIPYLENGEPDNAAIAAAVAAHVAETGHVAPPPPPPGDPYADVRATAIAAVQAESVIRGISAEDILAFLAGCDDPELMAAVAANPAEPPPPCPPWP